jgi:hypothetical protein
VIVSDIENISCDVHQNEKCREYLYVDMLLHRDVLIKRSEKILFGGVVQS